MADLLTYESDNPSIVEMLEHGIHFSQHLLRNFNIVKGESYPVIIQGETPLVHILNWGIENPMSEQAPNMTYIYGPTIEKQLSLKDLVKHQRVLIPVQKFVHRRDVGEQDVVITHPHDKVLWMAGLWSESNTGRKGFGLIVRDTDESKRTIIRRIPLFFMDRSQIHQWLDQSMVSIPEINNLIVTQSLPKIQTNSLKIDRLVG